MSMLLAYMIMKNNEGGPPPPPPVPPAPTPAPPETKMENKPPVTPDKDVSTSSAAKAAEKRRILGALPRATKTVLEDKGEEGTIKRKKLLGAGGTGSSTLG